MILDEFDGKVPDNMQDLCACPGGRKIANLILGEVYGAKGLSCCGHSLHTAVKQARLQS